MNQLNNKMGNCLKKRTGYRRVKTIVSIVLVLLTFSFSGCGQSSTDLATPGSNNTSAAAENVQTVPAQSAEKTDETVQYDVPKEYADTFTGYEGRLTVAIDAQIDFPDAKAFPVYELKYIPFSQSEVDCALQELIGDVDLYYPDYFASKSVLQERLDKLKVNLDAAKKAEDGLVDGLSAEELEKQIKETEEMIAQTPDSPDGKISSQYYSENNCIAATAAIEGRGQINFNAFNTYYNTSIMEFSVEPPYYQRNTAETGDLGLTITKQDAIETAVKTAEAIGAKGFEPVAVVAAGSAENGDFSAEENIQKAYEVIFTRSQDSLQTLYTGWDQSFGEDIFKDDIAERTQYENLKITVDERGVEGVSWTAHCETGNKISDNAKMLPFEQVMQKFEDQVLYNFSNIEQDKEFIYSIDRIKLGYLPVKQKDTGLYYWTPVWSFYGNGYYNDGSARTEENQQNYRPIIILDAVDGRNIVC